MRQRDASLPAERLHSPRATLIQSGSRNGPSESHIPSYIHAVQISLNSAGLPSCAEYLAL